MVMYQPLDAGDPNGQVDSPKPALVGIVRSPQTKNVQIIQHHHQYVINSHLNHHHQQYSTTLLDAMMNLSLMKSNSKD